MWGSHSSVQWKVHTFLPPSSPPHRQLEGNWQWVGSVLLEARTLRHAFPPVTLRELQLAQVGRERGGRGLQRGPG